MRLAPDCLALEPIQASDDCRQFAQCSNLCIRVHPANGGPLARIEPDGIRPRGFGPEYVAGLRIAHVNELAGLATGARHRGAEDARIGLVYTHVARERREAEKIVQAKLRKVLLAIGNRAERVIFGQPRENFPRVVVRPNVLETMLKVNVIQFGGQGNVFPAAPAQRPQE